MSPIPLMIIYSYTGCKSGVYGEHCNKTCPDNCQENRCDIINGTCVGCNPGWNGTYCHTRNTNHILIYFEFNYITTVSIKHVETLY